MRHMTDMRDGFTAPKPHVTIIKACDRVEEAPRSARDSSGIYKAS